MMPHSELKYRIQLTRLEHERERGSMYKRHQEELQKLLSQCRHVYDNGSSARVLWEQSRTHWGYECSICGCKL